MAKSESLVEQDKKRRKKNRILTCVLVAITTILLAILILNVFVYVNIEVDGVSMYPTLENNDVIKANKTRSPRRGDIVVINKYEAGEQYKIVKRVIAMEGDHIEIKDGKVYIGGEQLVEEYLKDDPDTIYVDETKTSGNVDLVVPNGMIFYLGDNRVNSIDSREDGCAHVEDVVGVVEGWTIATRGIRNFFFDLFFR